MSVSGIQAPFNQLIEGKERQLVVINSSTTVPKRLTALGISSITRSGTLVTVTTSAAHWLAAGDEVVISGADEIGYNSTSPWRISTVPSTTTFTYTLDSVTALTTPSPANGTLVGYAILWYHQAIVYGQNAVRTNNTGDVYTGPTSTNGEQPNTFAPGDEKVFDTVAGEKRGLHNLYLDVATANDGLVITYH